MKKSITLFALAAVLVLGLIGCGSGNNSGSNSKDACSDDNSSSCSAAEKTPAEKRQAVADKMGAAGEALDADAVKALFLEDEHELVEQRICVEMRGMKKDGFKVTMKSVTVEEKDGKFYANFDQVIEKDGQSEDDKKKLRLLEKDGKWYLSFKRD